MIKDGQAAGFSLSEIRKLLEYWDAGKLTVDEQAMYIQQKLEEVAGKIVELERLRKYLSGKLERLQAMPVRQFASRHQ